MSVTESQICILAASSDTPQLHKDTSSSLTTSSESSEIELSVLSWFEGRGVRQTNPEDVIHEHHCALRITLRHNVRKLSAPDELSMIGRRRHKENVVRYL